MWAEVAYGMPPAKAGADSRAAHVLVPRPVIFIRECLALDPAQNKVWN